MRTILGRLGTRIPRPTPAMGVALLALLIACSGAAFATIPSDDGTITACRDNRTGVLRAIDADSNQTCRATETLLSWKDGINGKVADALHADQADNATNADTVDGKNASDFYAEGSKVVDSAHADQADSATSAGDANTLDGKDSAQFADATHPHSGADITSGTVEADRIEDGAGSNLDADTLDGLDSTELGTAASAVNVERLELMAPDFVPGTVQQTTSETVFETQRFELRGVCSSLRGGFFGQEEHAQATLLLVAKDAGADIIFTREGDSTQRRRLNSGESALLDTASTDPLRGGDPHTYTSYLAETPPFVPAFGSFLHGLGSTSVAELGGGSEERKCSFNVSGLGQ